MPVEETLGELDQALLDFRIFLETDNTVQDIKTTVDTLSTIVPPVSQILTKLITLLNELRSYIAALDVTEIPGVDVNQVFDFTDQVKNTLESAKSFVPDQAATIDDIVETADTINNLPELLKTRILENLDAIIALLR